MHQPSPAAWRRAKAAAPYVMNKNKQFQYRRFLWVAPIVIVTGVLIVVLAARKSGPPRRVTITVNGSGNARVGGIPLVGTNLRDGVFTAIGAVGVKAGLAMPSALTNGTQISNTLETLKSMGRAGLLRTNQSPSPYE
jgi:hypothetical protein